MDEQLHTGHRVAQQRLAHVVRDSLARLVYALPDVDEQAAMDAYTPAAVSIVTGGQRQSATFAFAYMRALIPPARGRAAPTIERALIGRLVTVDSPVARSPVLRMWARIAEGEERAVARQAAASYANALASGDLQAAQRGGLEEAARATGKRTRWRKHLNPASCEWCRKVGGERTYASPDKVPFHERDECSVAPVVEEA